MTPATVDVLGNGLKEHRVRRASHMSQAFSLVNTAPKEMGEDPASGPLAQVQGVPLQYGLGLSALFGL